jgi:hypothetical protein
MVCLALAASAAANPVGTSSGFTVYADPGASGALIIDIQGFIPLYVVHTGNVSATASQFIAPKPPCFDAIYIGDTTQFPTTIGNSQTGISIAYGMCINPPIHILTINYFGTGNTGTCCFYALDCDPADPAGITGRISAVDCSATGLNRFYIPVGISWINYSLATGCGTPVENTTWGKIKSQYSDDAVSKVR